MEMYKIDWSQKYSPIDYKPCTAACCHHDLDTVWGQMPNYFNRIRYIPY